VSEEQEEAPKYPKPPFEAVAPADPPSGAVPPAAQDTPRVTRGLGGRSGAKGDPSAPEPLAHEPSEPAFPAPPFPVPPLPAPEDSPAATAPATDGVHASTPVPPPPFPVSPSEESSQTPDSAVAPASTGSISFQEPGVTTPREPTLAESRARYQAEQEAQRQREIEELHEENKRKWRRRLIGGVAVVGIVGAVALVYIASPERRCYNDVTHQEMPSSYCTSSYSGGGVGGVYIFHHTGWFGSSPYSGSRFGGGYNSGRGYHSGGGYNSGGDSSSKSSSSSGGVQRGGINPGSRGSSSS
jgi:hypothetical protein